MDRGRKIRTLVLVALSLVCLVGCASTETADASMRISVSDGSSTVIYRLNDSLPAQSLYSMLPFDVSVGDFLASQKIFYPPEKVEGTDGIEGDGEAGDLALFYPWGDIVMYYGPFNSNAGLFILGTAESGTDKIKDLRGIIRVDRL
ncbi:MAG: hypothetical protein II753_06710 [Spirochaetales bacterium]|nr:hypothetical protein [Spirochaetales bacterium]